MQSLTFFHIKRLPRHLPPFQHGEPVYRRDGTDGVEPIRVCICLVSESECKDSKLNRYCCLFIEIFSKNVPLANFLTTHHRKINFFLISLLQNLELMEKILIFAARKETISSR